MVRQTTCSRGTFTVYPIDYDTGHTIDLSSEQDMIDVVGHISSGPNDPAKDHYMG